jgi:hypothetical protein
VRGHDGDDSNIRFVLKAVWGCCCFLALSV